QGVQVERLGVFAVLKEPFHGKDYSISVRRPVFQLDISAVGPQHISYHDEIIPDGVEIEPLNYRQLSQATGISLIEVQRCVQETILMFHHLLRDKEDVSFAFKNIGVLTYEDEFLCTRFYFSCITELGNEAHLIVLLQT
ncbi:CCD81 protein, partial [Odontophorus gujanensis]|nr:CCD81 protein [Odontophorus gujanensis]